MTFSSASTLIRSLVLASFILVSTAGYAQSAFDGSYELASEDLEFSGKNYCTSDLRIASKGEDVTVSYVQNGVVSFSQRYSRIGNREQPGSIANSQMRAPGITFIEYVTEKNSTSNELNAYAQYPVSMFIGFGPFLRASISLNSTGLKIVQYTASGRERVCYYLKQ